MKCTLCKRPFRSKAHYALYLRRLAIKDSLENGTEAEHLKAEPDMRDVARVMVQVFCDDAPDRTVPYWLKH